MENEQEEINKETTDEFMLVTTQAIALLEGYQNHVEELEKKSWFPFTKLKYIVEHMKTSGKIINLCHLQQLHLSVIIGLHRDFTKAFGKLH